MNRGWRIWCSAVLALVLWSPADASLPVTSSWSATPESPRDSTDEAVQFRQRNLSGPRLGMTMMMGGGETIQTLRDHQVGRLISQFGWHFERQIVPLGGGPQFIVESVPMVGGVEYGKFIPSLTLAMGVRFPSGIEFGMGPSVSAGPSGGRSSLVIAGGRSFDYGGVSLPINVVLSTNPKGQRLSLIIGYAIRRTR